MARSFSSRSGIFATVACANWDDFRTAMRSVLLQNIGFQTLSDRFVFRGQSCSSWGLISSFDRLNAKLSTADREKKYKNLLKLFVENYEIYGKISPDSAKEFADKFSTLTDGNIEAIAQHYGLNTRLLDWSFSPYVAAFFATSRIDQCTTGNISIWALDLTATSKIAASELQFRRDLYPGNSRNLWQMGAFTQNLTSRTDLVDLFKSASTSFLPALNEGPPFLIRFDIPAESEDEILDDLQLMRINSMTIFPGLEGVVGWLKKKAGSP